MLRTMMLCFSFSIPCAAADLSSVSLAEKGKQLFSDDFERDGLGEWKVIIPTFHVENGVLNASQGRDDHGAVGRVHRPMKDAIVEFKFKLTGSTTFNAVFDDQDHKASHAGHICRVAFTPKQIRLGDDKEGVMRNDIFEMRRDPVRKAEADALIVGRTASFPHTIDQEKWYSVRIQVVSDTMSVFIDDKPVGVLQSPGLAHETKSSFHFTVNGAGTLFDDVRIWGVR